MKASGYSLWLIPDRDSCLKYAQIVNQLAGKYKTPVFDPHITLMGGVAGKEALVVEKTKTIASLIKSFTVLPVKVKFTDYFFKALFIDLKHTPEIMAANQIAGQVLDLPELPEYLPHLSLMYSDFPESIKKEIVQSLGNVFKKPVQVVAIDLYKCQGEVTDWQKITSFKLNLLAK